MKLNESKYTNDFAAVMFWTVNLIINRMKLSNHDLGGDRFVHVLLFTKTNTDLYNDNLWEAMSLA